jgi:hypothetical protein
MLHGASIEGLNCLLDSTLNTLPPFIVLLFVVVQSLHCNGYSRELEGCCPGENGTSTSFAGRAALAWGGSSPIGGS